MCESVRAVLPLLIIIGLAACSGDDGSRPPVAGGDQTSGPSPTAAEDPSSASNADAIPCADFDKRECVIDLPATQGVHNCTKGVQICEKGQWTPCAVLSF